MLHNIEEKFELELYFYCYVEPNEAPKVSCSAFAFAMGNFSFLPMLEYYEIHFSKAAIYQNKVYIC